MATASKRSVTKTSASAKKFSQRTRATDKHYIPTRVLELSKGKNSIDVGTVAELLSVLETVKKCVEAGELDAQIDAASAAVKARFNSTV